MTEIVRDHNLYVVPKELARSAFQRLMARRVHNFFPGYLVIRREAEIAGTTTGIRARYEDMGQLLRVAGATEDKPFLRPFTLSEDPSSAWMNRNLAGSWAPSSVREGQPPRHVVEPGGNGSWNLLPDHAALALEHLLFGEPLDLHALALFLYRDYGFYGWVSGSPTSGDVVRIFLEEWGFFNGSVPELHEDTSTLFASRPDEIDVPLETWIRDDEGATNVDA